MERSMSSGGLWEHLDSAPQTMSAAPHLPAYGSDGDYFSKPSVEDIVERVYAMVSEDDPASYPDLR